MESELGKEGWKEIVIVLENGEYLVMKREYYYTVLLRAFKSIVRGSVTSALPGVFLEIQFVFNHCDIYEILYIKYQA